VTEANLRELERALEGFINTLTHGMGRQERRRAMRQYITGLLLDGERKSIEPMAARLVSDPAEAEAMRQRLQQCVSVSPWNDDEILCRLALHMEDSLPGLEAFVIDDTGFPKKGKHSVGVARQYSGTLGRVDNCQVATSLHLAGEKSSVCIGMQLYLPQSWIDDPDRRRRAGIPEQVSFQRKWEIALSHLDRALAWGLKKRVVLADAGYGDATEFRDALEARGLPYVVGISASVGVWRPGQGPEPPALAESQSRGRPATRWRVGAHAPVSVGELALQHGRSKLRRVQWGQGSRGPQSSRFGRLRVRISHGIRDGQPPGPEQWLLYEWPAGEKAPTKFWLSTLPANTSPRELARLAKLRWRVERDYQEMKQEVGLDHFEGRTWRGFHHHATLCAVAHAFLALRRALFSPDLTCIMDAAYRSAGAPDRLAAALG
jgi:SRSO17 transposase